MPKNTINLSVEQSKKVIEILELLEENEDVQNTFANCKLDEKLNYDNNRNRSGLSGAIAILKNDKVIKLIEMPVMAEGKKKKGSLIMLN